MSTVFLVPDDPAFDAIGFDVTTDEQHLSETTPTTVAIEDGSSVSDHVIKGPAQFACTVVVTGMKAAGDWFDEARNGLITISSFEPGPGGQIIRSTMSLQGTQAPRRANFILEMQERLEKLKDEFVTMTIITSTKEYDRMHLHSIALPRGPKTIGKGEFTLQFRELRIVITQSVNAPQPKEPKGATMKDKGQKAPNPLEDLFKVPTLDPNKSIAKQLGGYVGGFF